MGKKDQNGVRASAGSGTGAALGTTRTQHARTMDGENSEVVVPLNAVTKSLNSTAAAALMNAKSSLQATGVKGKSFSSSPAQPSNRKTPNIETATHTSLPSSLHGTAGTTPTEKDVAGPSSPPPLLSSPPGSPSLSSSSLSKSPGKFVKYGWNNSSFFMGMFQPRTPGIKTKVPSDDLLLLRKLPISFYSRVTVPNGIISSKTFEIAIKSNYLLFFQDKAFAVDALPDRVVCLTSCKAEIASENSIEVLLDIDGHFSLKVENEERRDELLYAISLASRTISLRDFEPLARLAHGHFGRVTLVKHRARGIPLALKEIPVRVDKPYKQFEERAILCRLSECPLIARLLFSFREGGSLYFCTELGAGGDLWSVLRHCKTLSEESVLFIGSEMLVVIEHLHSIGIVHRDIKLENILLDHRGHIKVVDFGLSKVMTPVGNMHKNLPETRFKLSDSQRFAYHPTNIPSSMFSRTYSMCGTNYYMPPEMLKQEGVSLTVDYWQLGCLVYELFAGVPCFYAKGAKKIHARILEGPPIFPANISSTLHNLVMALLEHNPEHRLGFNGASEVKKHPFFASQISDWGQVSNGMLPIPAELCKYLNHSKIPGESLVDRVLRSFPEATPVSDFERKDSVFEAGGGNADSKQEDDDNNSEAESREGGSSIIFRSPFSLSRKESKNEIELRRAKLQALRAKRKKAARKYSSRKSSGLSRKSSKFGLFAGSSSSSTPVRPEPYLGFEFVCSPSLLESAAKGTEMLMLQTEPLLDQTGGRESSSDHLL